MTPPPQELDVYYHISSSFRWAYDDKGVPKNQARVIFAGNNFWGRTLAAISSSSDPTAYTGFGPYMPGFSSVRYDNLDEVSCKNVLLIFSWVTSLNDIFLNELMMLTLIIPHLVYTL